KKKTPPNDTFHEPIPIPHKLLFPFLHEPSSRVNVLFPVPGDTTAGDATRFGDPCALTSTVTS
ncbi:hypothetical protein OFC04_27235, partial [Escherichia coli]|nr:hypothetical protein [Escherichia coli]